MSSPVRHLFPAPEEPRLLSNLSCGVSGLLFDLDFREDLRPYYENHPRLAQIRDYPPLLVYADPRHCTHDRLEARVLQSLDDYPQLARSPWDRLQRLRGELVGTGFRHDASGREERHRLTLFSSANPTEPLGLLWLGRRLTDQPENGEIHLAFELGLTYVLPQYRGLGYGTALALAAGICCGWEIRHQAQRFAAASREVVPSLNVPDYYCTALAATLHQRIVDKIREDLAVLAAKGARIRSLA
ncbi:MAG: hypothetical protein KDH88_02980 [Chromatiales bacterium]|nr:hypothetical protein [Chromatiales bacterium]